MFVTHLRLQSGRNILYIGILHRGGTPKLSLFDGFCRAQTISVMSQICDSRFYVHDCVVIFWYPSQYIHTYCLHGILAIGAFCIVLDGHHVAG
jgi:hypothetical protein